MVLKCLICSNKYGSLSNVTFHRFPKDSERFCKWLELCRRLDLLEKNPYICKPTYRFCSEHFVETDFNTNGRLNNNAVPSVFNWSDVESKQTRDLEMIPEEPIPGTSSGIMANSVVNNSKSLSSINWSNISCSTPKTSSASRLLTFSSGNSSTSETQTHQHLSSHTPRKAKLNKLLSIQKSKFNDHHNKFLTLKKHCSDQEKSLQHICLI